MKALHRLISYQRARLFAYRSLSSASLSSALSLPSHPSPLAPSIGIIRNRWIISRFFHIGGIIRHESPAHPHDHDHDHVNEGHGHRLETEVLITKTKNQVDGIPISQVTINKSNVVEKEDDEDMEEMFILGPAGMEWGGPTRGGRRPEVRLAV